MVGVAVESRVWGTFCGADRQKKRDPEGSLFPYWRRGWDLNPRRAINPCQFSRLVHSTALPPLQIRYRSQCSDRAFCSHAMDVSIANSELGAKNDVVDRKSAFERPFQSSEQATRFWFIVRIVRIVRVCRLFGRFGCVSLQGLQGLRNAGLELAIDRIY